MFEHTMCSSNLQGTQVKETGRYLQARDLSPFLNRGQMFARDHSLGSSPLSIDCWMEKMGKYILGLTLSPIPLGL